MTESQLFMTQTDAWENAGAATTFGQRGANHRYRMPLLPGEKGTKSVPKGVRPWVPWHVQSATNLAGAISESYALGVWGRRQNNVGIGLRPDLFEKLRICVMRAQLEGVDFKKIKSVRAGGTPASEALKNALDAIDEEARQASGANAAGVEGTNRHDVWETRAETGQLVGTPEINYQILALEALLERTGFERLPGMSERVVRNVRFGCAGRFDDVLWHRETDTLYMADLKTKRTPFFSLLELWIQLTIYATAEHMLTHVGDDAQYMAGPATFVNQETALVLHMPADGSALPALRKLDLVKGARYTQLARDVCTARSDGKSAESMSASFWPDVVDNWTGTA